MVSGNGTNVGSRSSLSLCSSREGCAAGRGRPGLAEFFSAGHPAPPDERTDPRRKRPAAPAPQARGPARLPYWGRVGCCQLKSVIRGFPARGGISRTRHAAGMLAILDRPNQNDAATDAEPTPEGLGEIGTKLGTKLAEVSKPYGAGLPRDGKTRHAKRDKRTECMARQADRTSGVATGFDSLSCHGC